MEEFTLDDNTVENKAPETADYAAPETDLMADAFGDIDEDLFGDLSEEDLELPEEIKFKNNESVTAQIVDVRKAGDAGFRIEVKVMTGDHAGKLTELAEYKPTPYNGEPPKKYRIIGYKKFLLALWDKEEVLKQNGKTATLDAPIGRTISFTVTDGQKKQYFKDYSRVEETETNNVGL